jgi:enamine deaminase RidA (YjgF/YER057c/UK114 family)
MKGPPRRRWNVMPDYLEPDGLGPPTDPFTHVITHGDFVFVAGQISLDENNEIVGIGDPAAQAEQCWRNIELALASAGATVSNIVKLVVFLKDIRDASAETTVRKRLFAPDRLPVCTQVQVANLGFPELLMELDVTAIRS